MRDYSVVGETFNLRIAKMGIFLILIVYSKVISTYSIISADDPTRL